MAGPCAWPAGQRWCPAAGDGRLRTGRAAAAAAGRRDFEAAADGCAPNIASAPAPRFVVAALRRRGGGTRGGRRGRGAAGATEALVAVPSRHRRLGPAGRPRRPEAALRRRGAARRCRRRAGRARRDAGVARACARPRVEAGARRRAAALAAGPSTSSKGSCGRRRRLRTGRGQLHARAGRGATAPRRCVDWPGRAIGAAIARARARPIAVRSLGRRGSGPNGVVATEARPVSWAASADAASTGRASSRRWPRTVWRRTPDTPPRLLRDAVNDLYRYEIRGLRDRCRAGEFPVDGAGDACGRAAAALPAAVDAAGPLDPGLAALLVPGRLGAAPAHLCQPPAASRQPSRARAAQSACYSPYGTHATAHSPDGARRTGRPLRPATWDEALDRAAAGFRSVVDEHGPQAFGLFSCSKSTNEMNYAAQKFARAVIGSNNIDSCNRT